ncbi:Dihydrolipoyllysine-residue acetyltransferase component of pyruvate dehydrogenase complex [Anaerolineae bacterium]|nr:Dihydrolipoyllysine-residue acetyltransferase component of pyruvate dehydrogenase complex [Anaerolineae bacterium]
MKHTSTYMQRPFPAARQIVIDAGRQGSRRHLIHGLLELDVTPVRQRLREHKQQTGEGLSFTAFVVRSLAAAIDLDRRVQGYRDWRNRLIVFDEVDVVTLIETERGGVALPHIIRAANTRSFRSIHDEIRSIQTRPDRSAQQSVLTRLAPYLPAPVRDVFYWLMLKNPPRFKQYAGTCVVTSVGMFGQSSGWGIGFLPMHTLGLTVGGIAEKPGVIDGQIVIREYLDLTITFDHDIVDGAPAARFAQRFKEVIESGRALDVV